MNRPCWITVFLISALLCSSLALAGEARREPSGDREINLRRTVTVEVVRKTKDAVVNISATKTVRQRVSPFGDTDPFWQFFDSGETVDVPASSLGSGFIVHPDGYVVTNHHVIDRARQIQVELTDGRKLPADLISSDAEADLAILKIAPSKTGRGGAPRPFPIIELGDSSDLMIGEPVIAVGNPLGYSHSVSTGIVSAIHRDLKDQRERVMLTDLVQTDAAINPGNSGGPLLNAYGQVIGINTAIRGDAQNIGFAIQVNRLRDLIPELMNPANVHRLEIPVRLREQRRLTPPANVQVNILRSDNKFPVVGINGHRPKDIIDAYAMLLQVKQNGKVQIEYAQGPAESFVAKPVPLPETVVDAKRRLGITVQEVTPMLAEKYQLQTEEGLFIAEVLRDTPAARAGLKPGDVLIQAGRFPVSSLDDLGSLLQSLRDGSRVRVFILRSDRVGSTVLEL
ncbi:MAG: S1C family serine protease [Bacillota bacterium]